MKEVAIAFAVAFWIAVCLLLVPRDKPAEVVPTTNQVVPSGGER